jgi:phosphoglycolate phosphatase-like HAD superfamily hydrolase
MDIDGFDHVLFDMDGVLLDSNHMKIIAAREAMADVEPTVAAAFVEHFRRNFGLSRAAHFAWGYEQLLRPLGHGAEAMELAKQGYARRVAQRYAACPLAQGARTLLARLRVPRYVITGSDQVEARRLLAGHGVASNFVDILGSPASKVENLGRLVSERGVDPARAVLIGDSHHDFAAARAHGVSFVLVTRYVPYPPGELADDVLSAGGAVVETLEELIHAKVASC